MKTRILTIALCFAAFTAMSQVKTPAPSPGAEVEQIIGLTEVQVEYSRPGMKGREIFGGLVPYNEMWRTGANKNTIIEFEHDVTFGGKEVAAGEYAIFIKPGETSWEIYLYTDTENWGTPEKWEESKVAASVKAKVNSIEPAVENFTIGFDHLSNNDGHLVFSWAKTMVSVKIEVPTAKIAGESIEMTLEGPGARDYYSAAKYYRQEGQNLEQAKDWINMAVKMSGDDAYWMLREKALILAEMEDYKGAIEAAQLSKKSAQSQGNQGYVRMNEESIKMWTKMK
ncbi:DUF2911 domain-containing protein [Halocola ammonii]